MIKEADLQLSTILLADVLHATVYAVEGVEYNMLPPMDRKSNVNPFTEDSKEGVRRAAIRLFAQVICEQSLYVR